jgi:hypothetical protein
MPTLLVDWGKRIHFKNTDKAKRVATKLNKHYQEQLQALNFTLALVYPIYRKYWLFLKPYDNRHILEVIHYIENELDHAFAYEAATFNTPGDINRVTHDLTAVVNILLLISEKRKDIPIKHELNFIKQRIEDEYKREYRITEKQHKRAAIRHTGS